MVGWPAALGGSCSELEWTQMSGAAPLELSPWSAGRQLTIRTAIERPLILPG